MQVKCPTCHRAIEWEQAPYRPFCSERCRLIDLGAWLTERNAIPGETEHHVDADQQPPEQQSLE